MRRTSVPCPSLIAGRALRRGCGRARGRKVRRTRLRAWSLQRPWPPSCEVCAAAMGARSAASMAARRGRGPYRSARCRCGEVQFAVGTRSAAANAVVARGPVRHGLMAAVVARFARCGCARLRQHARWCVFCSMWAVLLVQHRRSSRVSASTASSWARTHMQRVGASSSGHRCEEVASLKQVPSPTGSS